MCYSFIKKSLHELLNASSLRLALDSLYFQSVKALTEDLNVGVLVSRNHTDVSPSEAYTCAGVFEANPRFRWLYIPMVICDILLLLVGIILCLSPLWVLVTAFSLFLGLPMGKSTNSRSPGRNPDHSAPGEVPYLYTTELVGQAETAFYCIATQPRAVLQ